MPQGQIPQGENRQIPQQGQNGNGQMPQGENGQLPQGPMSAGI